MKETKITMKPSVYLLLVALLATVLAGAQQAAKPGSESASASAVGMEKAITEEEEPSHHLVLENAYTKVFKVELAPKGSMKLHRHDHDYVSIVLETSDMETQVPGKPAAKAMRKAGEAKFTKGGFVHSSRNLGDHVFRNVIVEIRKPGTKGPAKKAERVLDLGHGHMEDVVEENAEVRVTEVQIAAGMMSDEHVKDLPQVIVALTECDLLKMVKGQPTAQLRLKAGDTAWIGAGERWMLHNKGADNARYIAVGFKG
jgi:quercetin dioxygenase-like cupin family protein